MLHFETATPDLTMRACISSAELVASTGLIHAPSLELNSVAGGHGSFLL
jgi:hypothetical protein